MSWHYNRLFCFVTHSLREVRPKNVFDFFLSLFGWGMLTTLIWYFELIDGLLQQVTLTVLFAALPLGLLGKSPKERHSHWGIRGLVLFILACLSVLASQRFGISELGFNVSMLLITSPFLLMFATLIRKKPLLGVGLVPSTLIAMVYLVLSEIPTGERLDYLLLPLPLVLLASLVWASVAWVLLVRTERCRTIMAWGPAMEALTMLFLFLPLILLAVTVPQGLALGGTWLAVSVTIVGVLLSSVVSVPLRQCLLELGKIPPNRRWEGCDKSDPAYGAASTISRKLD